MQHEGSSFYMTHFKRIVINDLLSNVALSAFNIYTIWYLANVVHSQSAVALFGCAGFVEIVLASFGGRLCAELRHFILSACNRDDSPRFFRR